MGLLSAISQFVDQISHSFDREGCYPQYVMTRAQRLAVDTVEGVERDITYVSAFSEALVSGQDLAFADYYARFRVELEFGSHSPWHRVAVASQKARPVTVNESTVNAQFSRELGIRPLSLATE